MTYFVRELSGEFIQEFSKVLVGKSVKNILELNVEFAKLGGLNSLQLIY